MICSFCEDKKFPLNKGEEILGIVGENSDFIPSGYAIVGIKISSEKWEHCHAVAPCKHCK